MKWLRSTLLSKNFWLNRPHYSNEKSNLTVTVVVPAWNEEDFIRDTIEALLVQTHECRIIVVDDSSTDRTPDIVREYPTVRLLTTDRNQGSKSRALNYAIPYVDTDVFICVDADTSLHPDAVENLLKAFNDPDVAIACGYVYSKSHRNFWESGRFGEYLLGQNIFKSAQQNANIVLVASGCFFAIRTDFLRANPFPTRTIAEDMDLTWTAIEHGHRVAFVENAHCSVSDPDSFYLYDKQVSRWYRGFFQNMKVRNFNLFRRSFKLGFISYTYMIANFFGIPVAVVSTLLFIDLSESSLFLSVLVWFGLAFLVCLYSSFKSIGWQALNPKHYFNSTALSLITYYIYVRSAVEELVLNRKLDTWTKGH